MIKFSRTKKVSTYHISICLLVKSMSEYGHNEQVDKETDNEGDRRLQSEVFVGFSDLATVFAVHAAGLNATFET